MPFLNFKSVVKAQVVSQDIAKVSRGLYCILLSSLFNVYNAIVTSLPYYTTVYLVKYFMFFVVLDDFYQSEEASPKILIY